MYMIRGLIFLLCICHTLCTAAALADDELAADRAQFKRAYAALTSGNVERARSLIKDLQDYPLYIYYRFHELQRKLHRTPAHEVREFLSAYDGSLLAKRLRSEWLERLYRAQRWQDFLQDYRPQSRTKLRCAHLTARIRTKQLEGVLSDARALWLVGKSQPDDCNNAFEFLKQSGALTDQLLWQRVRLAFAKNNTSLARYLLKSIIDPNLRIAGKHWLRAHSEPKRSLRDPYFNNDNPLAREILIHAIARIARKDIDYAAQTWQKFRQEQKFTVHEAGRAQRILGVYAAKQDHARKIELLDQIPTPYVDNEAEKYRLRAALKTRSWENLVDWTGRDPAGDIDLLRWRYWRARALKELGRDTAANLLFRELAKQRDYYGFLSADQLGVEYRMNDRPIVAKDPELSAMLAKPGIRRARELYRLQMQFRARQEWIHEIGLLSKRELEVAAHIVHSWGWNDRAILALGKAKSYDDLSIRFPLNHADLVRRYAAKRGLESSVIYSIIRSESAFMADARSPAGALGLMQLMPATGRETARRIGAPLKSARELLIPAKNVTIGTAYLKQMLNRFDGNFAMAAAAYNAGPHRVKAWRPESGCVPADIWIDTIPFTETRRYVRRASFYTAVYDWRLNDTIKPLHKRLYGVSKRGSKQQC